MFEKEPESFGSLTWRVSLNTHGSDCAKRARAVPKPLEEPINYTKLKKAVVHYIKLLQKGKIGNDDFKEEIFVEAVEAVYGFDVWEWVRANIKIDSGQETRHLKRYLGEK